MNLIQRTEWRLYKELRRLRLKNRRPTILSSNCVATFIYHDMKLRFSSPTVNLSFDMNDYVRFLEDLPRYLQLPLTPCRESRFPYPCGMLGDVQIRFNHYADFAQAQQKWEQRRQRVDWNNLFIIGIDGDGCTEETMRRFDRLPYPNKVLLTHVPRPDLACAYYLPGFEHREGLGVVTEFTGGRKIRRYLDRFDYVAFLNGKH